MEIFSFYLGIIYLYTFSPTALVFELALILLTPRYPLFLFFILGISVAGCHQWWVSTKGLADQDLLPKILLQGRVASIPTINPHKTQFNFELEAADHHPASGLIQLAWYQKPPLLHVGQKWQLWVKLKRPKDFANPGSYPYVQSLATRHITWTGYVLTPDHRWPAKPRALNLLQLREHLAQGLSRLSANERVAGIVQILTLNFSSHISQSDWDLFRRTGTTHLFGISGEHIALVSGLVFTLIRFFWSRSAVLCLYFPARYAASITGVSVAAVYALLAGFGPPVQRALIGCFFYTLICLGKRHFTVWQIWRYAIFLVLLYEPHVVFMQGFYFSFLAVMCLLLTQQRWQLKGYKASLALQLSCLLGLMPLSLYWFSYGSINGYLANLFAIPLVGLLIVPLALIALCTSTLSWAWIVMYPLSKLIELLFYGLQLIEHLAFINLIQPLYSIDGAIALMGGLLVLVLLPLKPLKPLAWLWLVLPFIPPRLPITEGEALIRVLDVGQGLAVVVHTRTHTLLYDTGDQFYKGSDLGTIVILPYLTAMNIHSVDKLIISHPDKDHRGGLNSILKNTRVYQLLVNNRRYYHHPSLNCHHQPAWEWDGVSFRFLPIHSSFKAKNNSSCILQIKNQAGAVLFTGDIEQTAEDYLVTHYKDQLQANVLLVPHHGSKTSSSYRFLLEVAPQYAIASLGAFNRFHFPHSPPLARMERLGIDFYRTDQCGMTQVILPKKGKILPPVCYKR